MMIFINQNIEYSTNCDQLDLIWEDRVSGILYHVWCPHGDSTASRSLTKITKFT